jgi:hypothetical protein
MTPEAWKPLTEEEAIRKADEDYLREERSGHWSSWTGDEAPPWWVAGAGWVDTVLRLAIVHRAVLDERRFDDTVRGRLVGEIRRLAGVIYDRKIWPHDGPLPRPETRREFVDSTQRQLMPTLAMIDQEVLICTEPEECTENATPAVAVDNAVQRREAIDNLLAASQRFTKTQLRRNHIWKLARHQSPRQFERWQSGSSKATASDDRNFRHILSLNPEQFVKQLRVQKLIPEKDAL